MNTRRDFIKNLAIGGAMLGLPVAAAPSAFAAPAPQEGGKIKLKKGDVILFQGDSITDAGRDRRAHPNNMRALGHGYVLLTAAKLKERFPSLGLVIHNRGISGHKVPDLAARWDADCINLKPTVVCIMIGINDYWHTVAFGAKYVGTPDTYRSGLSELIEKTRKELPNAKIILCEPFALDVKKSNPKASIDAEFVKEVAKYRAQAKKIADDAKLVFVPFQTVFDNAVKRTSGAASYWSADGIHPDLPGAQLMADALGKVFE